MIRLCKLLTSQTRHHLSWLAMPQRLSVSYVYLASFSSMHNFKPNQSIWSSSNHHDMIDENIIHEALEFTKNLPREDGVYYQRLFDKYTSVKELSYLLEEENRSLVDLFNYMGNASHDQNNYSDALRYFLQVSDMVDRGLVKMNIDFAFNDMGIASTYFRMNEFDKADEFLSKATRSSPDIPDDETLQLLLIDASCLRARIALARGHKEQAKGEFEAIKSLIKRLPYENQPAFVRTAYINVGNIHLSQNETQLAIDNFKEGLVKVVEYNGEEGQETEELYLRLAQTLTSVGTYRQALEYAQKGYIVDKKLHGDQGSIALDCLIEVRNALFSLGEYKKCIDKCKELIKLLEGVPIYERRYLLSTYFMMVGVSLVQKEPKKVEKYYKLAMKKLHESFEENILERANACIENADFLKEYSFPEHMGEVKKLYTEAVEIYAKLDHLELELSAMKKSAQIDAEMGNYDEAIKYLEFGLGRVPDSGDFPRELEHFHSSLCTIYDVKGENELAVTHLKKTIEICKAYDNQSGLLHIYYTTYAAYLESSKDFAGAKVVYQDLLEIIGEQEKDRRVMLEEKLKELETYLTNEL